MGGSRLGVIVLNAYVTTKDQSGVTLSYVDGLFAREPLVKKRIQRLRELGREAEKESKRPAKDVFPTSMAYHLGRTDAFNTAANLLCSEPREEMEQCPSPKPKPVDSSTP